jgi:hypothetical protein
MKRGGHEPTDAERRVVAEIKLEGIRRAIAERDAVPAPSVPRAEPADPRVDAYRRLWRSVRGSISDLVPPASLDASVPEHLTFALAVVGDYDAAREDAGVFADCLYRPASQLPYPSDGIRSCCELLIRIADADRGHAADRQLLLEEREALGLALFSLDYFLEVPAEEIPRQKLENLDLRQRYLARSQESTKPHQGDVVCRCDGLHTDTVADVIGLSDKNEWMVLTGNGSSVQVVRGPQPGQWDEVKEIVAAAVSWLKLTPPTGIQQL